MKKKIVFMSVVLSILLGIFYLQHFQNRTQLSKQDNTKSSDVAVNKPKFIFDLESEGNEYESEYQKTSSSSGWIKPENPGLVTAEINPIGNVSQSEWDELYNTTFKEALDSANSTDSQYQHLLTYGYAPSSVDKHDFNGDGNLDTYISSVSMGCASCRIVHFSIFIEDQVYYLNSHQGSLIAFKDENGFTLTNFGDEPSLAAPNTLMASKYYWEENVFKEKLQKTIYLEEK